VQGGDCEKKCGKKAGENILCGIKRVFTNTEQKSTSIHKENEYNVSVRFYILIFLNSQFELLITFSFSISQAAWSHCTQEHSVTMHLLLFMSVCALRAFKAYCDLIINIYMVRYLNISMFFFNIRNYPYI